MPGLKHLPVMRLLAIAELALLARTHIRQLAPEERRRLVVLTGRGRGMSASERKELSALLEKLDVYALLGPAGRLLPVHMRGRFTRSGS